MRYKHGHSKRGDGVRLSVVITEKGHPHYGEHGELIVSPEGTIQIYNLFDKECLKIKLTNCQHQTDSCFVGRDCIKQKEGETR